MSKQQGDARAGGVAVWEGDAPGTRQAAAASSAEVPLEVALLTGGQDRHYAVGLATALLEQNVGVDVIGSDEVDGPEFRDKERVRFVNIHGPQTNAGTLEKIRRLVAFYVRLFRYALSAKPRLFHILWNNKLQLLDRTLVMLLYKAAGKRIVLTAHNVNAGRRDERDSWLNRITLKWQYRICDHLFVHTKKMRDELESQFGVTGEKITVIPYGINNAVPFTSLSCEQAKKELGLAANERVILYFGAIKRYKGLEYLVAAFQQIAGEGNYRLIIAGERKKGYEVYWDYIRKTIEAHPSREQVLQHIRFIPDTETELYFKAADVAVLSYTEIFQSGILFMALAYGLPVIATDVGSLAEEIVQGRNGYVCKPRDVDDLARTITHYFDGDLYRQLAHRRVEIRELAFAKHSWTVVSELTRTVYGSLLGAER